MMLLKTSETSLRGEDEERALYVWRMSFMARWVSVNLDDKSHGVFISWGKQWSKTPNRRRCPVSQTQRWGDRRRRTKVDKTQKIYQPQRMLGRLLCQIGHDCKDNTICKRLYITRSICHVAQLKSWTPESSDSSAYRIITMSWWTVRNVWWYARVNCSRVETHRWSICTQEGWPCFKLQ